MTSILGILTNNNKQANKKKKIYVEVNGKITTGSRIYRLYK